MDRMPKPLTMGRNMETTLEMVHHHYKRYLADLESGEEIISDATDRYVCGYPVPPFQRDIKWDDDKCKSFIESGYRGVYLGTYIVHAGDWDSKGPARFTDWVIDGQQRMYALQRYWDDEISVNGLYWSELNKRERYRFLHTKFRGFKAEIWDEDKIRELYNLMNFGGVAHTADEMA